MLYPVFIDAAKTRAAGRKYGKELAVASPKLQEIKGALDRLKLEYKADTDKRHPRDQMMRGRFSIKKTAQKTVLIKSIVSNILEERTKKTASKSKVPNLLNLVPVKKKKGNKNKK